MVSCAVSCIKYAIFAFNFLFLLIGVALLWIGIYVIGGNYPTEINAGEIVSYTPAAPYVVLVVGLVISVVAFLGCCGACMQNTCMLMSFSVVMMVLLVVQLGFGLYGLINYDVMIEKGLYATLDAVNDQPNLQQAWHRIQKDNECCGVKEPADWYPILGQNKLPYTCCPANHSNQCTINEARKTGCKEKLVEYMKENLIVWFALGFTVIILVQSVGTLFTSILFCAYRRRP